MANDIPQYPKPEPASDPVARSISKPDAFAKPGTVAKPNSTRVRWSNTKPKATGKRKRGKRDYRDVNYL